eukprot:TRINITY_DN35028_c0_g1_i3.p1 TRINITY_DN35028_c0_g1~~TRINITY_DN35028_c0_g1_i3.p1  ORF type:complete len:120 (+),score=28.15 TRINITY_DN35028_c0_g1_i3:138-497(+)
MCIRDRQCCCIFALRCTCCCGDVVYEPNIFERPPPGDHHHHHNRVLNDDEGDLDADDNVSNDQGRGDGGGGGDPHWRTHPMCDDLSLIHISEPTRLLSISYAVFCLKKKKKQYNKKIQK